MSKLTPKQTHDLLQSQESCCLLDVRSLDEFRAGHIPGAHCLPLDQLERRLGEIPRDQTLLVSCQSGSRAKRARALLEAQGFAGVQEVAGGLVAWSKAGLPVQRLTATTIPIQRQVMIVAGSLVFLGSLFAHFVAPQFLVLPAFVGAGLIFAGLSGFCGMAKVLEWMPWNRVESTQGSTKRSSIVASSEMG